ncbi:MAG: excalibur calcium-binding domain-containing protein [Caulobacterales bacterium]|nr:excalibur calcium-binding domain-containing protein [Caulobacterales bacterium]
MLALAISLALIATHPGGTDSEGCHRERATGQRHCHGGGRATPGRPRPESSQRAVPDAGRDRTAPTRAFPNCTAARAAGRAPLRRGEPGYGPHLDRDNDGIACESR